MFSRPLTVLLSAALVAGGAAPALAAAAPHGPKPPPLVADPADHVDPLIGTRGGGNVFPGAVLPFGMLSWSPENTRGNATRTAAPGGYHYDATRIRGFSLTHMSGTGCAGGSGDIPFFPHVGEVTTSPAADTEDKVYASGFEHSAEEAEPGRYKVALDSGATAELTATARTGSGRFTFPEGKPASLLVRTANSEVGSTDSDIDIDPATRTISGSVTSGNFCGYLDPEGRRSYYTLHFSATFDRDFTATGTWQDDKLRPGTTSAKGGTGGYGTNGWPVAGKGAGGYVRFAPGSDPVNVKVGISYVSKQAARANLAAENPERRSFTAVSRAAHEAWNKQLSAIRVGGGTDEELKTFYTALYHSLLHPNVISDADGRYMGGDGKVHKVSPGHDAQYGTYSGWDVYRSQLQLLTLLRPDVGSDVAQSLLNLANHNGGLWDRWIHNAGGTHVMNGDPAAPSIAGIHAFGGTRFDVKAALDSLVKAATEPTGKDLSADGKPIMSVGQRPSLDRYLKHHYMPSVTNAWGAAAETLEISTADFALAQLAAATGRKKTAKSFAERAQWWQNNFNVQAHSSGGYIANRKADGSWVTGFTPGTGNGFVEGTSAQYTWMVQHNPAGLFAAMGGKKAATSRLDSFFHNADGSWAFTGAGGEKSEMDNEPSINVPYLYAYAGQPYKTQQTVRAAMHALWSTKPGGIPGNDDLGAMSSWYVFSALGMYPQVPSRAELVLASPLFDRAVIERGSKDITVTAQGASADAPYVQSLKVNGKASGKPWLPASFVARGGTLDYTLGKEPNRTWGSDPADAPPSFRDGEQPYQIGVGPTTATLAPGESAKVRVSAVALSGGEGPEVRYSVDAPDGITATPASGAVEDGTAEIVLSTTEDTEQGFHDATVTVTTEGESGSQVKQPITLTVAAPGTLLAAYNNTASTDDEGEHDEGDFDGGGWSYSRQALAAEGLTPGVEKSVEGLTFSWPSSPAGRADNAVAAGQRIDVGETSAVSFIGSATNGNAPGKALVTYTDGSTGEADVSFTDWTVGGGGGTVQYGNITVARTGYRNVMGGDRDPVDTYIFATRPFQAPEGKTIKSVTLPENGGIHVFAVAVK